MRRYLQSPCAIFLTCLLGIVAFLPPGLAPLAEAAGLNVISSLSPTIIVGETTQLHAVLTEDTDIKVAANFYADNSSAASGLTPTHPFLTANAPGKVTVTAQYSDPISKNFYTGSLTITIIPAPPQALGRIFLLPAQVSADPGETVGLTARYIDPVTGQNSDVTSLASWGTGDKSVAESQGKGKIKALSPGITPVTASYKGASVNETLTVIAPPSIPTIKVTPEVVHVGIGETTKFRVDYYPGPGAYPENVTENCYWLMGKDIAISDKKGSFIANKTGETTISVSYTMYNHNTLWDWVSYQVSKTPPDPENGKAVKPSFSSFPVGSKSYSIDYQNFQAPVATYVLNGRTYLPQRPLAEAMGVSVSWNGATGCATFADAETGSVVVMQKGSTIYSLNGVKRTMDAAPRIVDGSLTCPARYLTEAFGYDINFNRPNNAVIVSR